MSTFDAELRRIVEQTDEIADPLERWQTRRRLTAELYRAQAVPDPADDPDLDEIEAGIILADSAVQLDPDSAPQVRVMADHLDEMARHARPETAARLRANARHLRARANAARRPVAPPRQRCQAARPRERRERRHVARATSSADSGGDSDPDEPDDGPLLARLRRAFRRAWRRS